MCKDRLRSREMSAAAFVDQARDWARGEKPVRPLPSKHHDGKGAYFAKADLSFDAAIADRALSPHAGAAA